ncbi:E3 ubiquitin-protein ligase RNF135 [Strongylocentrotus purpuratus]|uniref:Ubiquitin n=1 Tax=Strongylocentrotus purpuratus TaxID=7668 RepID=A0A7M7GMJ2_STRPU|nr:E3 ubiquitin-protein ligase RNF135 [Strongylocentrotus purpuratus]|eukprot:XP_003729761.1 PREDICTED: E3 ubiquitin-protein ligase RNF135-like [Strongylocentrotus purpuratus]
MESHVDLKSMYADLVENLNCAICQDVLKEARDLSCGHTYCLKCLQELVAMKGWTSDIKCCLCQKMTSIPSSGLNGLKQNYKLNCILDEQAAIMKKMEASLPEPASATPRQQKGTTEATKTVQIWVRDLEGKSQSIHVRLSDTADALKRQVDKKTGIPPNVQRLIYQGKQMEGSTTLEEYNIGQHSTIELTIPLKGGNMTQ